MVSRWLPYFQILVGVLLLTTPALWQPGADYATVTYDAGEVEYTDDYLRVSQPTGDTRGLACYGLDHSRYCALESYVARQGPVTVSDADTLVDRSSFVAADGFYRPIRDESGENVTLGLEPVAPGTVLEELSEPVDELSDPAQEAVETGETVTVRVSVEQLNRPERRSSRFVAGDDSYYLLRAEYTASDGVESPLETPVKVLVFGLGLWLVLRGQAKRRNLGDPPL